MNTHTPARLDYLDSLRGLAAFSVVIYHFLGGRWNYLDSVHITSMIFNGSDAVSFFFVLSGFVLSYGLFRNKDKQVDLKDYFIKRVLRLYPAYIITILLNFLYVNRHEISPELLQNVFLYNSQNLWNELVMLRGNHKFYVPGWTLEVEMALSLLVPVFVVAALKNIRYILFLLPVSILLGSSISMFTFHFSLGIILAYYYENIISFDFKKSGIYPYRWPIYLIIFLLFSVRHIDRMIPFGEKYQQLASFFNIDLFHYSGFAAFLIILIVLNNASLQRILITKPLLFLGKISYSIYLMHWIIVVYIIEHYDQFLPYFRNDTYAFIILLFVSIVLTIVSATLLYYFVEKPFINLAKKRKKATA